MSKYPVHYCDEYGIRKSSKMSGNEYIEATKRDSVSVKACAFNKKTFVLFLFDEPVDLEDASDFVREFVETTKEVWFDGFVAQDTKKGGGFND